MHVVAAAERDARAQLAEVLPRRWRHVQAVSAKAQKVSATLPAEDRSPLIAAAWLHDIGYTPELATTGFHPLDGARWLRSRRGGAGAGMNRPAPDPAVVALAREMEQLRREVDQHRADIERAQETGDTAHRVIADLVDRVAAVADNRSASVDDAENGHGTGVESWLSVPRPAALDELIEWMDQVLIRYPGTADALGQCWSLHPWIVEELLALRAAWMDAYRGDRASGTKAVDWHERQRPGVMSRVAQGTAGCSIEAHQPGGRLDRPAARVPMPAAPPPRPDPTEE